MTSTSSNDGTSSIRVFFTTGYNKDIAAVDVQNRVSTAQGRLPQEIKNTGITISKANSELRFCGWFLFARWKCVKSVHLELSGCLCKGPA